MDPVFIFADELNISRLIKDFAICANILKVHLRIDNKSYSKDVNYGDTVVLTLVKNYGIPDDDEFMIFYTGDRDDYLLTSYNGKKMYCLTSNESGGDNKHLLLEWCHEYLKLNPSHTISSGEEEVYELKHLEIAKRLNLYYWIETDPSSILGMDK